MAEIMQCELIGWQQVHTLSRRLALQVKRSYQADIIIAIGRGGFVPARILADYLDMMALTSIKIEHYKHGAEKQASARVTYPLGHDISALRVLLVDDVSDSGDTYQVALEHLAQFRPSQVKTAAVHHKSSSYYVPDYYAEEITQWRWLIYPWAVMEDLSAFLQKMAPLPDDMDAIRAGLQANYGVTPTREQVKDALSMIAGRQIE